MLPSILAEQLQQGIKDFLRATFPSSTSFFHGMLERMLEDGNDRLFKGPYLSIQLPFKQGSGKHGTFPQVPMRFAPYLHQEQAFARLRSEVASSTLVATGTGSGKSECFLFPILDHCLRNKGQKGIKAVLIYPMNALATDQSKRIARLISGNKKLKEAGITAGLYIGDQAGSGNVSMSADDVITDHELMRDAPPDILMTNYKMLDYLLLRPEDQKLWNGNDTHTLQYVVVDELHTFDGAQGTDLACLIRRLKDRLDIPPHYLCCVGTSATIGGKEAESALQNYAEAIFGERFEGDCIIRESRLTPGEYLIDSLIMHTQIHPHKIEDLNPNLFDNEEGYLRKQYSIWFGEEVSQELDEHWRLTLGEKLKQHIFFQNLVRVMKGDIHSLDKLVYEMTRISQLSDEMKERMPQLLDSLCSLISAARTNVSAEAEGDKSTLYVMPFLHVRVQLWLRELRRMVADVSTPPKLRFADDRSDEDEVKSLPLIQCRECGATGWGGVFRQGDDVIRANLRDFYLHFFKQMQNLIFLYPSSSDDPMKQRMHLAKKLCSHCLYLSDEDTEICEGCGEKELVFVRLFQEAKAPKERGHIFASRDCPYCESSTSLTILGSRAASLTSVLISQLYGSFYNDDKKAITFSDSVQDAAHRAGFFGARTYRFNFRAALLQCVQAQESEITLADLPEVMSEYWSNRMEPEQYAVTFLAPNMEWLPEYGVLQQTGQLPPSGDLLRDINKRMSWEVFSEYGYRARIGRTLERSGSSVAFPNKARIDLAVQSCLEVLRNELEALRDLDEKTLRRFILGWVMHLKLQGGVYHPGLTSYVEDLGNTYILARIPWMPGFSPNQRPPRFLADGKTKSFDTLSSSGLNKQNNWYERWALKFFEAGNKRLWMAPELKELLQRVTQALTTSELLEERICKDVTVWGLHPQSIQITTKTMWLGCSRCAYEVTVALQESDDWEDMPCLHGRCSGHYQRLPYRPDYYHKLYSTSEIQRIIAKEHTGLLDRPTREAVERSFIHRQYPWEPNLLSATPTLEMGIDIGELSSVVLCSVPPTQASYLQRIGRAGRRDGNALNLTLASGRPHDLYFFDEPLEMMAGDVKPPGVFLRATAVLERQLTAFCLQRWINSDGAPKRLPHKLSTLLNTIKKSEKLKEAAEKSKSSEKVERPMEFPFNLFQYTKENQVELLDDFMALFYGSLDLDDVAFLRVFLMGNDEEEGSLSFKITNGLHYQLKERKALESDRNRLTRLVKEKKSNPAKDQNYKKELNELEWEHAAIRRLRMDLNNKNVFNFLTDEGLLPNYAFPEAGVTLKSLIYRVRKQEESKANQKSQKLEFD